MAGHHPRRRPRPVARAAPAWPGSRRSTPRRSGSRPARGSPRRRAPAPRAPRRPSRRPCARRQGAARAPPSPSPQYPGHRQRLDLAERERRRPLDVVALVEVAQFALGRRRLGAQTRGRRLRHAERGAGKRQPPEQVVPVAVGGQQPAEAEPGLVEQDRQRVELVGIDGRVDHERLTARAHDGAGRLPDPAGQDEDVGVEADGPHSAPPRPAHAMPRSLAASRRFGTSAVGFFWPGSSASFLRLTQITGTLALRHGSTSW